MSKRSKRPGREARDVHARIKAEAAAAAQSGPATWRSAAAGSEMCGLVEAARTEIEANFPSGFFYQGRVYYLRTCAIVEFDILDVPGADLPMLRCAAVFPGDGAKAAAVK